MGRVQAGLVTIGPGGDFHFLLPKDFVLWGLSGAELACQISGGAEKHFL